MPLSREEVGKGLTVELENFERLVRSLSPEEFQRRSRCEGWSVADVAAHMIGTMADITQGRIEGQGTPEVTNRQVDERRGRTAEELADELRQAGEIAPGLLATFDDDAWAGPSPGGYDFTLGEAVEALWYDAYVHADDIRAAIGRKSEGGDGLKASVSHVADLLTRKGWGPATLALDGLPEFRIGVGNGDGHRIEGDALSFVLAATGRAEPGTLGLTADVNVYA
jgi:uncharacterized protein (TIGR03083 family)